MGRIFNINRDRLGNAPGTVQFAGPAKAEEVTVRTLAIGPDGVEELDGDAVIAGAGPGPGRILWLDVSGLHDTELIKRVGERFRIDALTLEDVVATNQRAKVDVGLESIFVVARASSFDAATREVCSEQVSIVLGEDFVLSHQERAPDAFAGVRRRLEKPGGRLRTHGAGYLAFALLDTVVDEHLRTLSHLGDQVESLEEEMLDNTTRRQLNVMHNLAREFIVLRRAIRPLREVTQSLLRLNSERGNPANAEYFRDLYDHAVQANDGYEAYSDMLTGIREYYESNANQKLNEVMKVLTIISTIFVPMTFVAGVYGMNFQWMPELGWSWGYPVALGLMGAIAVAMLVFFRRRHWL